MATYLRFRNGVKVPKSAIIGAAAVNAANQLGLNHIVWVTSGNDKIHMQGSKHYSDEALDFHTKTWTPEEKHAWTVQIKARLGRDYDVVLEDEGGDNEHLHLEFDPK